MSDEPITTYDDFLALTFGEELGAFLGHAPAETFLRINPLRATPEQVDASLARYGVEVEPHPLSPLIRRVVAHRPEVPPGVCLPHFLGHYRLQSLSSMVPPLLLDAQPGEKVLDLCAAPGSKTTQLAAQLGLRGELWVNELSGKRMNQLAAGLDSAGALNTVLIQENGARLPNLFNDTFDRVLADVPCTGLGIVENTGQGRARFEEVGRPSTLPFIQYQLLIAALRLVRDGGRVVYSTCSLTVEENEAVLHDALERLDLRIIEPPELPGLVVREGKTLHRGRALHPELRHARRITPWENPTEGFFVAILERQGGLPDRHQRKDSPTDADRAATVGPEHPDVAQVLDSLQRDYGLDPACLAEYRYLRSKDRVQFTTANMETWWSHADRVGLGFAQRRGALWRPSPTAIQALAPHLTANVLQLTDDQVNALVATERCELDAAQRADARTRYPVIAHPAVGPFTTAEIEPDGRIRWKVPRRYVP